MFYLALNYRSEGWALEPFKNLDEIKKTILSGGTHGTEFKILQTVSITLTDEDEKP